MVKKRNRRTRKKYKKRGGFTDKELDDCNNRLKEQGVKGMVNRRKMCVKSNAQAGLPTQEPAPVQPVQPIAQPKEPTELKQSSGVESVIAPLEEEPEQPSIKDRASALGPQLDLANRTKRRKALRTTIGSCRVAVDKGNKYYYNEANETTWDPTDKVCHPTDGIEKTGRTVGDYCIEATYKNGKPYLYKNDPDGFSTHDMDDPRCFSKKKTKVEGIYKTGVDNDVPLTPGFKINKSATQKPKKVEEKKSNVECSELSNTKCKKSPDCNLVTKKKKGKTNNKKNKVKTCLPKTKGGKRTKRKKSRKKSRKKRKKSRKRRR